MFVAGALLVLTRVEHPVAIELQKAGRTASAPVLEYMNDLVQPVRRFSRDSVRFFTVEAEIRTLERELASLRQLLDRASDLEIRNRELAKMAKLVRTAPVDAVTVEVIAGPQGPFGRTVRIAAGRHNGLRYGQPVFAGDGLFGRIIATTDRLAQVLVLNEVNSRIPVEVGPRKEPALMVGDNTALPRLIYLRSSGAVKPGDEVHTSGATGVFPRGIRVGRVASARDAIRVETAAKLVTGAYVTVLKYNLPSTAQSQKATGGSQRVAAPTNAAARTGSTEP